MEIRESNGLIAEFMGWVKLDDTWLDEQNQIAWNPDFMGYHREWEWLMPVIEKILKNCSSNCHVSAPGYLSGSDNWYFNMLNDQKDGESVAAKTLIDAMYKTVVLYLKSAGGACEIK
jgi:hypothetical protein